MVSKAGPIGFRRRSTFPSSWLKQLRRCLDTNTRNGSSMSETPDEEVNYGSPVIDAIPYTGSDHAWSTSENDSQH
jgi:hypothetical protein